MAAELELIVDSAPSQGSREHGWARASLHLDGEPYWYGEDESGGRGSLDWTWIDLLHYLGRNWSALMLEQGCPLPLGAIPHPGKLLQTAEARWEDMPESLIHAEESQVHQYLDRHNLSTALSGANVPMLLWLRSGNTLWLVDEDEQACRVDFSTLRQQLEKIGDTLAGLFADSRQPHVQAAIGQWQQRGRQLRSDYLAYSTGLDAERLGALEKMIPLDAAFNDADIQQEPVYLAAARMVRHDLSIEQIAHVMQRLQQAPATGKQPFATLIAGASAELQQLTSSPLFEQGYQLARWLREQLHLQNDDVFDPETLLSSEGVTIDELRLDSAKIDAIACWGCIDPLILLNQNEQARAATKHGRRSTLAHEICHLLIDRTRALPVAEVLGGEVDSEGEKRANAFAAELLLPQAHATQVLRHASNVQATVEALSQSHLVSRQLIAYQLLNASGAALSEDEKINLRNYTIPL
ncbi:ImmA/IrrE family metallo-endopeptidase [Pseudomonas sp.]|uniref:ImmA/IrrE family metallo-endopeptidase n=1 Tax=Pseudomonas sp. TaxID=306 RepID=UPI0028AD05F8|nr:ImmA/IrrE family metallo-endopeptidase [Pseudomonas sp.]